MIERDEDCGVCLTESGLIKITYTQRRNEIYKGCFTKICPTTNLAPREDRNCPCRLRSSGVNGCMTWLAHRHQDDKDLPHAYPAQWAWRLSIVSIFRLPLYLD